MENLKDKLPSIIFNTVEFLLLFGISTLIGIAWYEGLCVLLLFTLVRNLVGKGKHYKNPLLCLLWSSLVFSVIFISVRIDYILAVVLTIFYAIAQTGRVDAKETFMWKGRSTNYDYIEKFIKRMTGTATLRTFEEKLEDFNPRSYNVYKYRFKKGYSFCKIGEILNIDNRRISEILKSLELAINLYFDIK